MRYRLSYEDEGRLGEKFKKVVIRAMYHQIYSIFHYYWENWAYLIQRSPDQTPPGTPIKKIYRGRISIYGFSESLGTKYDGLDALFSGKEPFI